MVVIALQHLRSLLYPLPEAKEESTALMARTVPSAKKGSRTETAISILLVNPEEPGLEPVVSASHPLSKRKMANTSH